MARGLYFQTSWVWARDIGDLDRGISPENPYDRRRERAVWIDIPTHRFTTNLFYQLPFGRGRTFLSNVNRAANLAVGGWEISGIYSYYSGQFLTPAWTGPDPVGLSFTNSRTPANVTLRPITCATRTCRAASVRSTAGSMRVPSATSPPVSAGSALRPKA